jgi:predicted transposase YdaD
VITTIAVYKITQSDRSGVETMLGINIEESRIYQEIKAEGEQIGEQIGEQRGELKGNLAAVPLLIKAGIAPEQIAAQLGVDIVLVQQAIQSSTEA